MSILKTRLLRTRLFFGATRAILIIIFMRYNLFKHHEIWQIFFPHLLLQVLVKKCADVSKKLLKKKKRNWYFLQNLPLEKSSQKNKIIKNLEEKGKVILVPWGLCKEKKQIELKFLPSAPPQRSHNLQTKIIILHSEDMLRVVLFMILCC